MGAKKEVRAVATSLSTKIAVSKENKDSTKETIDKAEANMGTQERCSHQ